MTTNIKFLIEGEEEVGSPNLETFVKNNKELLKADVILVSDSSLLSMENPSLDIGVRGLTYIQLEVTDHISFMFTSGTYWWYTKKVKHFVEKAFLIFFLVIFPGLRHVYKFMGNEDNTMDLLEVALLT